MRLLKLTALALLLVSPAWAHRTPPDHPAASESLSIPSLTHGQMKVIAEHLPAIRALADSQFPTDPVMRRLQAYVNLQAFACLWGSVPGSLTDEASPFNECAHAYLAGARALLVHLRGMGERPDVAALVHEIEIEMLDNNAALELCRFSDEPFNTGEIIGPRWREIPFHAPSALTFAAALAGLLGAAAALWRKGPAAQTVS